MRFHSNCLGNKRLVTSVCTKDFVDGCDSHEAELLPQVSDRERLIQVRHLEKLKYLKFYFNNKTELELAIQYSKIKIQLKLIHLFVLESILTVLVKNPEWILDGVLG
jgi:hypothetical protein